MEAPVRRILFVYAGLIALTAITSYIGLELHLGGPAGLVVALAIAFAKVFLIAAVFMELSKGSTLLRFAAAAGLCWLAILLSQTLADYLTRGGV